MGNKYDASGKATSRGAYASVLDVAGKIAMSTLWRPIEGVHAAANAAGPVVTNNAITSTAPSLTGMVFVPWNALDGFGKSRFNRQSQNWVPAHANFNPSQSSCYNVTNDRTHYLATNAMVFPSNLDLNFMTTSSRIVVQWQNQTLTTGTASTDQWFAVGRPNALRRLQLLPETYSTASGAVVYKDVTMLGRGPREFRARFHAGAMLQGVWIEQGTLLYPTPNKPLFVIDGDSWVEAANQAWNSAAGYSELLGQFQSFGNVDGFVIATGAHVINSGEGGTAWFNANSNGGPYARNAYNQDGNGYGRHSVFMSTYRVASFAAKFGNRKVLSYINEGSANDGTLAGTPQRANMTARMLAGIDDLLLTDPALPIILIGPQSYTDPTPGDGGTLDLNRLATMDAAAARPNSVKFIDQMDFTDGTGNNGSPATSQWAQLVIADGLHPNFQGAQTFGQRWADLVGQLTVSIDRLNQCLAA